MHYLCSFIKRCHICQLARKGKPLIRQLQTRIYLNYRPLSRLSMDLKLMSKSYKRHQFILCIIDEMTNYLITAAIHQSRSEEIGWALIENVISKYCVQYYIIMNLDSAFMLTLINYLFKRFGIKIKTIAPYNHQSLQVVYGIKTLSNILTKHLTDHGQMWPMYLPQATLAYNTYNSLILSSYSPYKLGLVENKRCFWTWKLTQTLKCQELTNVITLCYI